MSGFSASQVMEAKVAGFNMWGYELTVEQINLLTCESAGNLVTSSQLQLGGRATYSYEDFECGKCPFISTI